MTKTTKTEMEKMKKKREKLDTLKNWKKWTSFLTNGDEEETRYVESRDALMLSLKNKFSVRSNIFLEESP